jgi:hypothetical protein
VQFRDLEEIEFVWYQPEKSIKKLQDEYSIHAPELVIQQFYIDHRDKDEFIELYGDLDLHQLEWSLTFIPVTELIRLRDSATYPKYIEEVSEHASMYAKWGDKAIDGREEVSNYWKKNGTWMTPPIFIDGRILNKPTTSLHLVEGHTRVGCLQGLAKYKVIDIATEHQVYFGQYKKKALNK